MTLTDPLPGFQGHVIFEVENLKNGVLRAMHSNRKPYVTYGMVPRLMTLTDL